MKGKLTISRRNDDKFIIAIKDKNSGICICSVEVETKELMNAISGLAFPVNIDSVVPKDKIDNLGKRKRKIIKYVSVEKPNIFEFDSIKKKKIEEELKDYLKNG